MEVAQILDRRPLSRKHTRKSFVFWHHLQRPAVPCSEVILGGDLLAGKLGIYWDITVSLVECRTAGGPSFGNSASSNVAFNLTRHAAVVLTELHRALNRDGPSIDPELLLHLLLACSLCGIYQRTAFHFLGV